MKKIIMMLTLVMLLSGSMPLFAADNKNAANTNSQVAQAPKDTIFNRTSNFLSGFDKTYARRGNKQGFWAATADWMRNINK